MSHPKISVIIPFHNDERYIKQSLDSVLDQSFKNIEIICVNDGSRDSSIEIIRKYPDPRIHIVSQKHQGLAAARNAGINASKGLFIAMLDAHDSWSSEKLTKHMQHFQRNPHIDVSYSASRFMQEDGGLLLTGQHPKLKNINPQHIYCRNPIGNGSAAVMRKSFLVQASEIHLKNGIPYRQFFDESMCQSDDQEFWIRSALNTAAVFEGIGETLTYHRSNSAVLSADTEDRLSNWQQIREKNVPYHPHFYFKWSRLALSYQYRDLAWHAIQSHKASLALELMYKAIQSDKRILWQDPARTSMTIFCTLVSFLPEKIYTFIKSGAMNWPKLKPELRHA
ncbi:MAG: glycosyltransferase family 2 protein [Pseudomonadales bacterium]|nr:glycosyltransferase family 2 protein [Pseudomonadales bacterium]